MDGRKYSPSNAANSSRDIFSPGQVWFNVPAVGKEYGSAFYCVLW